MSLSPNNLSILLIGAGKMGGAMLAKWLSQGYTDITVIDPSQPPAEFKAYSGLQWHTSSSSLPETFAPAIMVLAIKPQQIATALPEYSRFSKSLLISIAAGKTTRFLADTLQTTETAIVRAMPNLPANIGQGITGAFANSFVSAQQKQQADELLHAIGEVVWLDQEQQIDPLTALSGSGPAYVFALLECMAGAGEKLGLQPELALKLAQQTIIGSGALLAQSALSAQELRQAVTSPGGTTEAALNTLLDQNGLPSLLLKAMRAATQRAKELAE